MTGASIETTLELWASSLRDVKGRMRGLFTQERVAASANLFLDGLLGDERRKTGWMRAEDHQFIQPLVVSVMERVGSPGVRVDNEGSGYGFRTLRAFDARTTEQPSSCKMERP